MNYCVLYCLEGQPPRLWGCYETEHEAQVAVERCWQNPMVAQVRLMKAVGLEE